MAGTFCFHKVTNLFSGISILISKKLILISKKKKSFKEYSFGLQITNTGLARKLLQFLSLKKKKDTFFHFHQELY